MTDSRFPDRLVEQVADAIGSVDAHPYMGPYHERGDLEDYLREQAHAALEAANRFYGATEQLFRSAT